jgi:hypothetical protein
MHPAELELFDTNSRMAGRVTVVQPS